MPIVKAGVKHKLLNSRVVGTRTFRDVALKFSVFVKGTGFVVFYAGFSPDTMEIVAGSPFTVTDSFTKTVSGVRCDYFGFAEVDADGEVIANENVEVSVPKGIMELVKEDATIDKFGNKQALDSYIKEFGVE